jgi:hypothetical protein
VAQALGSFLASTLVYVTYRKALDSWVADHCAGVRDERTGGVWATFPQPFETTLDGFVDQLVGTAVLLCGIFAVNDDRNFGASSPAKSASVAALVVAIGTAFGSVRLDCRRAHLHSPQMQSQAHVAASATENISTPYSDYRYPSPQMQSQAHVA